MIYVVVTACLFDVKTEENTIRMNEYVTCLVQIKKQVEKLSRSGQDVHLIVVENNHHTSSFFDEYGVDVVYTDNNSFRSYKGDNELADLHTVISMYHMNDNDFLVKITGRYFWMDHSPFFDHLTHLTDDIDCIVRYGGYGTPAPPHPVGDAVTGLIGMRVRYIERIPYRLDKGESIEMEWGEMAMSLPQERVISLNYLGIMISPGGVHTYFCV